MNRRPLESWNPSPDLVGAGGGRHAGVRPANIPVLIFRACYDGEKIDTALYIRLQTDMSLDEMYDILEMRDVADSWRHAHHLNDSEKD